MPRVAASSTAFAVSDLIVIQAGDATLVTTRDREGDVKKLVDAIKAKGLGRYL